MRCIYILSCRCLKRFEIFLSGVYSSMQTTRKCYCMPFLFREHLDLITHSLCYSQCTPQSLFLVEKIYLKTQVIFPERWLKHSRFHFYYLNVSRNILFYDQDLIIVFLISLLFNRYEFRLFLG